MFQHLSSVSKNFPLTIRFIIFVLIPIMAGSWYVYAKLHDGLPSDRTMLFNGGLSAPVSIVRDMHGVPNIDARTDLDAFFAIMGNAEYERSTDRAERRFGNTSEGGRVNGKGQPDSVIGT